jgi:RNA polymerase sigma-70 factor (ECF subfamily)
MMAAMQRLPEEQREVVALILVEGFGYRETAEMLELPIGTVSSRLVRGRIALLSLVGEP